MHLWTVPKTGFWTDHSRGFFNRKYTSDYFHRPDINLVTGYQILETDFGAQVLTSLITVVLTLIWPSVFIICRSLALWLLSPHESREGDQEPLLGSQCEGSTYQATRQRDLEANDNINNFSESEGSRQVFANFWRSFRKSISTKRRRWSKAKSLIIASTVLFGIFVAWTVAGIFSPKIATDRAALSASKYCGIWDYDEETSGEDDAYLQNLQDREKEARAAQYVRDCYGYKNSWRSEVVQGCSFFYSRDITYETRNGQLCPFRSIDLCRNGAYSAVTFDTGLVDASVIGVNSPKTHKFRRQATCSPLNASETYVREENIDGKRGYRYYYGTLEGSNYTLETAIDSFEWRTPGYSVRTLFSTLYPTEDYWQPLPELQPRSPDSTLTIIFVSSLHNYHSKASYDPIFPAHELKMVEGYREPFYYNSDPRAQAFACVDTTFVCSPDGQQCWSMRDKVPSEFETPSFWLMKFSLELSDIYDSIVNRLGYALYATSYMSQFISFPLNDQQWQVEAEQLFATSLARIQYTAQRIAMGENHNMSGFVEWTPEAAKGKLCGIYKFRTIEYTNVNVLGFFGLVLLAGVIVVLASRAYVLGMSANNTNQSLVIEVLARRLRRIMSWPLRKIVEFLSEHIYPTFRRWPRERRNSRS